MRVGQKVSTVKNPQFYSNHSHILAILFLQGPVLLSKFHNDWAKIRDFLQKPIFLASPVFMNYPLQGQGNWVWRVISCTPTFRPLPLKKTSFCIKNSDLPTYSLFCTPSFYLLLPTCFRTWNSREKKIPMHFFPFLT